jgi:signal peptidase II
MNRLPYFLIAGFVVGLDRLLKGWAAATLALAESRPLLGQRIRLTLVHNYGGAFGIFPGNGALFLAVSSIVAVVIIFLLLTARYRSRLLNTGLALVLGGAIGNLIDRALFGYVLDFCEVRGLFVNNLADVCVSVGVGLIVLYIFFGGEKDRASQSTDRL